MPLRSRVTTRSKSIQDRYEEAVVEMLKRKEAGMPMSRHPSPPRPQNVINLMDALRHSIAQEQAAPVAPKKAAKRIEGQREMLLPIAGQRRAASAKPTARVSARRKQTG